MIYQPVHAALFGVAIGDALGVPVEFKSRAQLKEHPVNDYLGYMSWNQPPGTWSDDSSLTFCLSECLCDGYHLEKIGQAFVMWYQKGYWGAHNNVFDIGKTTRLSLKRIIDGESAFTSGAKSENENGNGSLMRIIPLIFYLYKQSNIDKIYQTVSEVSSITHAHFISIFSCFIYVIYALEVLKGSDKKTSYNNMQKIVLDYSLKRNFNIKEFDRILKNDISTYSENNIESSGYVLHSLEVAFWCLLTENNFHKTVLKAVNLGRDTDTNGAITGGLAGLLYGFDSIPERWISNIVKKNEIMNLCNNLADKYV